MSYEITIKFANPAEAEETLKSLTRSVTLLESGRGYVMLKDVSLEGVRSFDVGLSKANSNTLLAEINVKSRNLYLDLSSALSGSSFEIIDDTDNMTTLEALFKSFSNNT